MKPPLHQPMSAPAALLSNLPTSAQDPWTLAVSRWFGSGSTLNHSHRMREEKETKVRKSIVIFPSSILLIVPSPWGPALHTKIFKVKHSCKILSRVIWFNSWSFVFVWAEWDQWDWQQFLLSTSRTRRRRCLKNRPVLIMALYCFHSIREKTTLRIIYN